MILERNTDFFGFKKIALFFVGQMEERPHSCFPLAANVDAQCNVDPSIQLPIWFSHTNLLPSPVTTPLTLATYSNREVKEEEKDAKETVEAFQSSCLQLQAN